MKFKTQGIRGATVIEFEFDATLDHVQVLTMARLVGDGIDHKGELRLLHDLRGTKKLASGAFLSPKEFPTSIRKIGPVSRYAVVGAPAIAAAAVEGFGTILPLKSRAFDFAEITEACLWVFGIDD